MNVLNNNKSELIRFLRQPLEKKLDQHAVERWAAAFWQLPKPNPAPNKKTTLPTFAMMFPPPNITGNLHLGHALTAALQDALIRQRRMMGVETVWTPGFDHAGLATQSIVEKLLWTQKGVTRQQYGREKFVELANEWKESKRKEMRSQLARLGLCLDHEREYFTMDENSSIAIQVAFKKLFNSGTIYRANKPIYWSEKLQTTLSDIEVEKQSSGTYYVRTGELVEKRSVNQWFIDTSSMAYSAVRVVRNSSINVIPENYKNTWYAWLTGNGTEDWCISRQSWWGHRIPAYKLKSTPDEQQNWVVADSFEEAREKLVCQSGDEVVQDPDVLDTWFSSSLLPLIVSGWPHEQKFRESRSSGLFPLDIMETGHDILNYWVAKMVMMSMALENVVPFKLILLHGMICDSDGKKMSKSIGNVIDPVNIIDGASLEKLQQLSSDMKAAGLLDSKQLVNVLKNQERLFPNGIPSCGADVLRAYLLSNDIQEEIVRVQVSQIEKIRRLSNKIWNIYKFTLKFLDDESFKIMALCDIGQLDLSKLEEADRTVLKKLGQCVRISYHSFESDYQLHKPFYNLEQFLAIDLSSKYLTFIKPILSNPEADTNSRQLKMQILVISLITATKLMHPFMPHLTEFLYQKMKLSMEDKELFMLGKSLTESSYPCLEDWKGI